MELFFLLQVTVAILVGGALALLGYLYSITSTPFQEIGQIRRVIKNKKETNRIYRLSSWSVADLWDECQKKYSDRECIRYIHDDDNEKFTALTYQEMDQRSNQVAHFLLKAGVKPQETVSMMMENSPEFMMLFYGCQKVGAIAAIINTQLTDKPLAHSISSVSPKVIVVSSTFAKNVEEALAKHPELAQDMDVFVMQPAFEQHRPVFKSDNKHFQPLDLTPMPTSGVDRKVRESVQGRDVCCLIFTSGTTGLPKAARILHGRFYGIGNGTFIFLGQYMKAPNGYERVYTPLPFYHSAACLIGNAVSITNGFTMITRRKFSASKFWHDCCLHNATIIQYIGETCRYLNNTPVSKYDKAHSISLAIGNGLRSQVWREFQDRFAVGAIAEFYGATESPLAFLNTQNVIGACGVLPPLVAKMVQPLFVRYNVESDELIKDANGFCIPCKADEVGEGLSLISKTDMTETFHGYVKNEQANERKVLRDVLKKGDLYYRSGDLFTYNKQGAIFFVDRIGDTFRWKGENCSTNEIQDILMEQLQHFIHELNVYGVQVNNCEGRAGMAVMVVDEAAFNLAELYTATDRLASYAAPVFLRITKEMDVTSTNKYRKVKYQQEGFNPDVVDDKLYFRDIKEKKYVPLDKELYEAIQSGKVVP